MIELGLLSSSAVLEVAAYLGKKVADGAAASVGAKVFDWLKSKLTSGPEKDTLNKLVENPSSEGARRALDGALLFRLEQDSTLAEKLDAILKETGTANILTQTVSGSQNTTIQSAGRQNTITLSGKS